MILRTVILMPLAVLALSPAEAREPSASDFNAIQRYAIAYDEPRDVAEFYVRDAGLNPRDASFEEIDDPSRRSDKIVLATVEGIHGPVQGVQWRLHLRFNVSDSSWETVEAGMRRKCASGQTAGEWTKEVCP